MQKISLLDFRENNLFVITISVILAPIGKWCSFWKFHSHVSSLLLFKNNAIYISSIGVFSSYRELWIIFDGESSRLYDASWLTHLCPSVLVSSYKKLPTLRASKFQHTKKNIYTFLSSPSCFISRVIRDADIDLS